MEMQFKKIITILGILLLSIAMVLSNGEHQSGIEEGRKLVESKISCDKLSDEQLEAIGQYYMEQMHPGESHEMMDKMMGGHGSESLKQMHMQMGKVLYCNESSMMGCGMMGNGMMSMMGGQTPQTSMMQRMMGNYWLGAKNSYWNFMNIFYMILLIGLIILVCLAIINLLKESPKTKR